MPLIGWETVQLSKRELEVLQYIASKGPRIEYKLQCELPELSRGTLHGVLERLRGKKKLLKPVPKGKARTGKTIKEYHLMALGIAALFANNPSYKPKNMLEFAERWRKILPLTLGKWELFSDMSVENVAKERFIIASDETLRGRMILPHESYYAESFDPEKAFNHNFYHPTLYVGDEEEQRKWVSALGTDIELKTYMAEILDLLEYISEATIRDLRNIWGELYASP